MMKKFDTVVAPYGRGFLRRSVDGTYTYVYTIPPTWEIHLVYNLKREELIHQPYVTQLMIDMLK